MKFTIYIAINKKNGKRYIGATSRELAERKKEHRADSINLRRGSYFHNAIRKYGWRSFKWTVLASADSWDQMLSEERRLISDLKPEYNLTPGGDGTTARSRPVVCLKDNLQFASARKAAKAHGITPSRVMQLCQIGGETGTGLSFRYADSPAVVRKERTPLQREAHRSAVIAALKRGQIKIKKRVVLVESGEVFDSIALAARKYHLNEKELYLCIEQGNPCRGFTFRILDVDGNPIIIPSRRTMRRVLCLTDMVVSNSILAASERYGVLRATLKRRCDRNDDAPIGARRFCYLDEWRPNPE